MLRLYILLPLGRQSGMNTFGCLSQKKHQKHFQAMTTVFPWSAEIHHCKISKCSHTACQDIFTLIFSLKYQLGQRI